VNPLARADAYLAIPTEYGRLLGGVGWSPQCDAIEKANGSTVAVVEEVGQLLDGVFARPPVPPFSFVLHLLCWMKGSRDGVTEATVRLRRAYTAAHGTAGAGRNAGRLIAELCRGLPAEPDPPVTDAVRQSVRERMAFGSRLGSWDAPPPPLTPHEFERHVKERLREFDDAALLHWMKFGTPPADAGEKLAEPAESLAAWVAKVLALARSRPRLVGAAVLVPALDAALTVPPRKPAAEAVPQGGYADVTTRGDPDRLLPSQLALDPDEFVRRFAGRELLFFKREEPHAPAASERVVVLDQGVRTWGGVRLALAAAAMSLLRANPKRVGAVRLAATSGGGVIDPTATDAAALAGLLEASDLTPHPAECLRVSLAHPPAGDGPRDVLLLTHPRNLREGAVTAAARGVRPADRLFALTVDDRGWAELVNWTGGGPVPVRSFRVDLAGAEAATVPAAAIPPRPWAPWTGDVEPVPFPFRPGLVAEPTGFGFDAAGDWLVILGRDGVLHGLDRDGSPPEVLPRAFAGGAVLKQVDAVLGVTGGVVVCGRVKFTSDNTIYSAAGPSAGFTLIVDPCAPVVASGASDDPPPAPQPGGEQFVAAHYDRVTRRVAVHRLGPAFDGARWCAFPELHSVVVRVPSTGNVGSALDLDTFGRCPGSGDDALVSRARPAWQRAWAGGAAPFPLPVETRWTNAVSPGSGPVLYLKENRIEVRKANPSWESFEPQRDGKPLLAGTSIERAVLAGNVLALSLNRMRERALVLFRGPDGAVLGECNLYPPGGPFALSADGRRLARRRGPREVAASDTADFAAPPVVAVRAGLHNAVNVHLRADPFSLTVWIGGFTHLFLVAGGRLHHQLDRIRIGPAAETQEWADRPAYDPARFPAGGAVGAGPWSAVADRLGQVVVFRGTPDPVAAFVIRREKAAAWGAGGCYWGDPALIGGSPTPDAAAVIGRQLSDGEGG
jgi:hypothetical protein